MELKLLWVNKDPNGNLCFNRTFMELKSSFSVTSSANNAVLIVPLWN